MKENQKLPLHPLEIIAEWRKGCSCAIDRPAECIECTEAAMSAIEKWHTMMNAQNYPDVGSQLQKEQTFPLIGGPFDGQKVSLPVTNDGIPPLSYKAGERIDTGIDNGAGVQVMAMDTHFYERMKVSEGDCVKYEYHYNESAFITE